MQQAAVQEKSPPGELPSKLGAAQMQMLMIDDHPSTCSYVAPKTTNAMHGTGPCAHSTQSPLPGAVPLPLKSLKWLKPLLGFRATYSLSA
mmetsp:Transcript_24582/g.56716  ORF Transcript_24582/g.56716 Transcript_24582/m.56716 type:complete len:90 (+) Transcript_24582:399-668(+)